MKNDSGKIGWNRLSALIRETLFYWRFIILLCFLCALLGGCLQTVRFLAAKKAAAEPANQMSSDEELEREIYERAAEAVRVKLASRQEYLANSILVKIDPYHTYYADANIMLSSEEGRKELADAVMNSLRFYIRREIDWTELAEEEETEPCYLNELVTESGSNEDNVINIKIKHFDEEKVGKIMDYLLRCIEKRDEELQEELGSHGYTVLNKGIGMYIDVSAYDWTESQVNRINTLQNVLADYEEKISRTEVTVSGISKKSILKMAVYGAFGGGLAALVLILLMLLQKNRLLSPDELKDSYGIPLLAVFPQNRKKRKLLAGIDGLIAKIGRYPTEKLTDSERYSYIAEKIRQLAGPEKGKRLALVGDVPAGVLKHTAEALAAEMKDTEIIPVSNVAADPVAVRAVGTSDAVVLVAGRGRTRMTEMEREICAVRELDRKIVGGIVAC